MRLICNRNIDKIDGKKIRISQFKMSYNDNIYITSIIFCL